MDASDNGIITAKVLGTLSPLASKRILLAVVSVLCLLLCAQDDLLGGPRVVLVASRRGLRYEPKYMAAATKQFVSTEEAQSAMLMMIDMLSANRADLLAALDGQDTQQKKIAAIMPKMQSLLAPEMTKLGFPPGPMGLMVGFAAFKKAATDLYSDPITNVIQRGELHTVGRTLRSLALPTTRV